MATDEELEQLYSALSNEQKTLHDFIVGGTEALIEYHSQVKEAKLTNQPAPLQPNAAKQILHFQSGVAYNMNGGSTVHQLLALPVQHGKTGEFEALSPGKQKALQLAWSDTALLIIDEVSMISSAMLTMIHLRLNDIFRISADSCNITQLHSKCFQQ